MKKFISEVCQFDWGEECLRLAEAIEEKDANNDVITAAIKAKV